MLASIGGGASTGGGLSAAGVPSDIFMLRLFRRDAPASRPAGAARDRGLLTEDRDLGVLQALAEASRVSRRWRRKARYSIRSGAPTWQLLPGSALPPVPCDVVDPPVPRRPVLRTSRRPHSSADLLWTTTSAPSGAGCPRSGRRAAHARCISKRPDAALSAVGCGSGTLACARSGREGRPPAGLDLAHMWAARGGPDLRPAPPLGRVASRSRTPRGYRGMPTPGRQCGTVAVSPSRSTSLTGNSLALCISAFPRPWSIVQGGARRRALGFHCS